MLLQGAPGQRRPRRKLVAHVVGNITYRHGTRHILHYACIACKLQYARNCQAARASDLGTNPNAPRCACRRLSGPPSFRQPTENSTEHARAMIIPSSRPLGRYEKWGASFPRWSRCC
jgi:hypothetical protein